MKKNVNIHFEDLDEELIEDLFAAVNGVTKNFVWFVEDSTEKEAEEETTFPVVIGVPGYVKDQLYERNAGIADLIDEEDCRFELQIFDPGLRKHIRDADKILEMHVRFLFNNS